MTPKQETPKTSEEVLAYINRVQTLCDQIKAKTDDQWPGWDLDEAQTLTRELQSTLAALRRWAK